MKIYASFLLTLLANYCFAQHPNLETVLGSTDLSYLIDNHVASHNPISHGWENFSQSQSPLGRFTVPLVMAMHSGEIYSFQKKGMLTQQTTTSQKWLPWIYKAQNDQIKVQRTVGKDIFLSEITSTQSDNIAVIEMNSFTDHYYRNRNEIDLTFDKINNRFIFKCKEYSILVTFSGGKELFICQDFQPILRKFQGFDDVAFVDKSAIGCWNRNGITYLAASFGKKLNITIEVTRSPTTPHLPDFETVLKEQKNYWTDFFKQQVPALKTKDKVINQTYYNAWVTLWSNHFEGGGGLTPYSYTASSAFMYPMQFFWDEFFHSIVLSNLKDPELPYQFIKNFSFAQAPDGGMPGSVNFRQDVDEYRRNAELKGSSDMQPILIGVTLNFLKDKPGWPKGELNSIYETYNRYINWLYKNRDRDGNGLVEYTNSFQSGADDSPRFDNMYPKGKHIGDMQAVEGVEQNVWLSLLHYNLSEMATILGDTAAAKTHAIKATAIEDKIEKYFWNEDDGMYYDINTSTHQQVKVKTAFTFMAFFLKNANKDRMARLVTEHLKNPKEFWLNNPIPCVSFSESTFTQTTMWRGPVWPNINWLICLGLEKQGYTDLARELALKTVKMVGPQYQNGRITRGPRFNEWFDPITGKAYGNENISWSCTVADLILRFLDDKE